MCVTLSVLVYLAELSQNAWNIGSPLELSN